MLRPAKAFYNLDAVCSSLTDEGFVIPCGVPYAEAKLQFPVTATRSKINRQAIVPTAIMAEQKQQDNLSRW